MDFDGSQGEFWIPGSLSTTGRATITSPGLQLDLDGVLQPPRSVRRIVTGQFMATEFGNPKDIVVDYNPTPIHGQLDDGRIVTLIDARADDNPHEFNTQSFTATQAIIGAHILPDNTVFRRVRVSIPITRHCPRLFSNPNNVEISMHKFQGRMKGALEGGIGWLEMTPSEENGLILKDLDRRYWNRIITLLRLWTDVEIGVDKRVQLQTNDHEDWAELVRFRGVSPASEFHLSQCLLPLSALSLEIMADALSLFDKLAPIPDIASRDKFETMTIEAALLASASCLEGIHYRCHEESKPFPAISTNRTRKIAKRSAQMIIEELIEMGEVSKAEGTQAVVRLTDKFKIFNEKTLGERLEEILPPVEEVAPGLIGIDHSEWIRLVVAARNLEAHRFAKPVPDYQERTDRYYQLAKSMDWALRIILLLEIGVSKDFLHSKLHDHQKFIFDLANMDNCRYPWPGSRFETFRKSKASTTRLKGD
ncbi:HEPN domain-containing protein [Amycolatopsis solani]|uniref:HEPN domain-containing protein n=1 Tax=Amycolatopsis solani TaxID=3028615 RepID=UPI0025B16C95|nr:HEPN domain-containing protein [Amycolatopsis sp. MEP2-6]